MKVEVSNGEILDKLSILHIKALKIKDEDKLKNINEEMEVIWKAISTSEILTEIVNKEGDSLYSDLFRVNLLHFQQKQLDNSKRK